MLKRFENLVIDTDRVSYVVTLDADAAVGPKDGVVGLANGEKIDVDIKSATALLKALAPAEQTRPREYSGELPNEPGLYWCSIHGKVWDSVLEIRGFVPFLMARVITLNELKVMDREITSAEGWYPRVVGPKIDQPSWKPSGGGPSCSPLST